MFRSTVWMSLVLAFVLPAARAQNGLTISANPSTSAFVPNGVVEVIEPRGDRIYVGGSFSAWGPATGSYAVVDPSMGTIDPVWPATDGSIRAIESDGAGGWFLAGDFTMVGSNVRDGLAHVFASGQVDPWSPIVDGEIWDMQYSGGTLFVAGRFVAIDNMARGSLAAFDSSLQLLPWNPGTGANFASFEGIHSLALHAGEVFAGGYFNTSFSGSTRRNFVAIDSISGAIDSMDPSPDGAVFALAVDGASLWLGGNFNQVAFQPRQRLASIDLSTSLLTGMAIGANKSVLALEVDGGNLYVGGGFEILGGFSRAGCGAIDIGSTTVTAFAPSPNQSLNEPLEVRALSAQGGVVHLGGTFRKIATEDRWYCGTVDASTSAPTPFVANVAGATSVVVRDFGFDGSSLAIAGSFSSVGAIKRHGAAALDANTLELLPWSPEVNDNFIAGQAGTVTAFAFEGNTVYLGGAFGFVNGLLRARIAAVTADTGDSIPVFDAGLHPNADGFRSLTVLPGGILADAAFLYDRQTGLRITEWTTATNTPPKRVTLSHDGTRVLFAGGFSEIYTDPGTPLPAQNLARVDPTSGIPEFGFAEADKGVLAARVDSGRVVVGGHFDQVGGLLRRRIAEIDANTGAPTAFAPVVGGSGTDRVSAVAMTPALVFCGGTFATVQGSPYLNLAAINRANSAVLNWKPNPDAEVLALAVARDWIVVGGSFRKFASGPRPRFAAFKVQTLLIDTTSISVAAGGSSLLRLIVGAALAGKNHWIVGSVSGVHPGFELIGSHVPLNLDAYLLYSFANPVNPLLPGGFGLLDSLGRASATFVLPAGGPPSLVGVTLSHAGIVYDPVLGKPVLVSNPVDIAFVP